MGSFVNSERGDMNKNKEKREIYYLERFRDYGRRFKWFLRHLIVFVMGGYGKRFKESLNYARRVAEGLGVSSGTGI